MGHRILVVEDDCDSAKAIARALKSVAAEVIGPYPDEIVAQREARHADPTGAILDVHLQQGLSFKLAETLMEWGIPFIFVSGDDLDIIPDTFTHCGRLRKPVALDEIVREILRF